VVNTSQNDASTKRETSYGLVLHWSLQIDTSNILTYTVPALFSGTPALAVF